MNKFNGYENHLIVTSLSNAIADAERDIIELEKNGKNSIYAKGYFTLIGSELIEKVNRMTYKKDLKLVNHGSK